MGPNSEAEEYSRRSSKSGTNSNDEFLFLEWEATRLGRAPWTAAIFVGNFCSQETHCLRMIHVSHAYHPRRMWNKSQSVRNSLELAEDGRVLARYGCLLYTSDA